MEISCPKKLTPVLMLVPYFAPQTHAAMFRAHKLAKYLPRFGYRPIVVTTDINYLYNDSPALLEELPDEVEIHRARFVEPTLRGLRMMLGGSDRTFATLKRAGTYDLYSAPTTTPSSAESKRGLMADIVRIFGEWPDRHWTWSLSARKLCQRLIRRHDIRLLYTSAVPVSPLRTAQALQHEFGLRWVADFRDPVGYGRKHSATGVLAGAIERRILARTMDHADIVTGLAASYGGVFFDLFGLQEDRYRFIPTGLDEAYLPDTTASPIRTDALLHIGEVMPNQSAHAFHALARAHRLRPDLMNRYRLQFIGRREINEPRVRAITEAIPGWAYEIDYVDHVTQSEVYARIRTARACLLIPGHQRYWWTNFAKMVDYIALGCPVIADVPPTSEARTELTKAGTGHFLGGTDIDADATALVAWLQAGAPIQQTDYGVRYTAYQQAQSFADILDGMMDGSACV